MNGRPMYNVLAALEEARVVAAPIQATTTTTCNTETKIVRSVVRLTRRRCAHSSLSLFRRQVPDPASRAPKLLPPPNAPKSYVATSPSSSARRDASAAAATAPLALRDFRVPRRGVASLALAACPSPAESSTRTPRSTAAVAAAKNPAAAGSELSVLGGDQGRDGPEGSTSSTDAGVGFVFAADAKGLAPPPP